MRPAEVTALIADGVGQPVAAFRFFVNDFSTRT